MRSTFRKALYGSAMQENKKGNANIVVLPPHLDPAYVRLQAEDKGCQGCHTGTARYAKSLNDKMRGYLQKHGLALVRELFQH